MGQECYTVLSSYYPATPKDDGICFTVIKNTSEPAPDTRPALLNIQTFLILPLSTLKETCGSYMLSGLKPVPGEKENLVPAQHRLLSLHSLLSLQSSSGPQQPCALTGKLHPRNKESLSMPQSSLKCINSQNFSIQLSQNQPQAM